MSERCTDTARRLFPEKYNDFGRLDIVSTEPMQCYLQPVERIETKSAEKELEIRELFLKASKEGYISRKHMYVYDKLIDFFRQGTI